MPFDTGSRVTRGCWLSSSSYLTTFWPMGKLQKKQVHEKEIEKRIMKEKMKKRKSRTETK
jgi:hypothetical protein